MVFYQLISLPFLFAAGLAIPLQGDEFPAIQIQFNPNRTAELCFGPCSPEDAAIDNVCGTNGIIYQSICEMKRAACLTNSQIERQDTSSCNDSFACDTVCLGIHDPVCGSDGRVYVNRCFMAKKNCMEPIDEKPMKHCYATARQGRRIGDGSCPNECIHSYHPVCGSDGKIYASSCALQMENCIKKEQKEDKVYQVPLSLCVRSSRCPAVCLPIPDPVCGSDKKVYINECSMIQKNCGKKVSRMPVEFCEE